MSIEAMRRRQRGVTLVELIMFMVIVGIALAGILQVMRLTTANSADPLRRKQALMIAEALLEEVRQSGFTYCDPRSDNAGEALDTASCTLQENWGNEAPPAEEGAPAPVFLRPYDNVNDYVAAAASDTRAFDDQANELTDALNRKLDVTGYTATVAIAPDKLGSLAPAAGSEASADNDALRIRVVVSYAGDDPVILDGYRARYAPVQAGE